MKSYPLLPGILAVLMVSTAACQHLDDAGANAMTAEQTLSNEAIFGDRLYDAESPVASRWHPDGKSFTVLETNPAYEHAEMAVDDIGDLIEHPKDLVSYDFETLQRNVILSAEDLVPPGSDKPLVIDDYAWSKDQSKLLLYSNSVRVWRVKSRGDYAVLDLATGKLTPLGGPDAKPSTLQFAKFSPDSSKVAYVREANIYVEDLATGNIDALTERASESIINGIMSWAYEEEFSIRDGFRWSPDGERIAYWQFDTSGVRDFLIINNTDTLYPTVSRIPYPKVGETVSAARIGVVQRFRTARPFGPQYRVIRVTTTFRVCSGRTAVMSCCCNMLIASRTLTTSIWSMRVPARAARCLPTRKNTTSTTSTMSSGSTTVRRLRLFPSAAAGGTYTRCPAMAARSRTLRPVTTT